MATVDPDRLRGTWRVRRISGMLPPGVTKQIDGQLGRTLLFGLHFGAFRIDGARLIYSFWPIVDLLELPETVSQPITGRGTIFGWTFCRFRLEPA
jgi:hypothetical protein